MASTELIYGAAIGIPLTVSLATGLLAWRGGIHATPAAAPAAAPPVLQPPFERRGPIGALAVMGSLGFVVAVIAARWSDVVWPPAWPAKAQEWVVFIALAAGLVAIIESFLRPYAAGAWLLRIAALLAALFLPIPAHIKEGWGAAGMLLWVGGYTLLGAAAWWGFDGAARAKGGLASLLIVVVCTLASITFVTTGHIEPAVLMGSLCACIGPGLIVGLLRPGFQLGPIVAVPAVVLTVYAILTAKVIGDTPPWCGPLLLLSAALVGVVTRGAWSDRTSLKATILKFAIISLPGLISVGTGVVLSIRSAAADSGGY